MGLLAVIYTVVKQPASCVGVSAAVMVTLLHPRLRSPHLLSWLDSLLNVSKMKYKEPHKRLEEVTNKSGSNPLFK